MIREEMENQKKNNDSKHDILRNEVELFGN